MSPQTKLTAKRHIRHTYFAKLSLKVSKIIFASKKGSMILLRLTRLIDIHPPKSTTDEVPDSRARPVTLILIHECVFWRRLISAKALTSVLHPSVSITFVHLYAITWYCVVLYGHRNNMSNPCRPRCTSGCSSLGCCRSIFLGTWAAGAAFCP